MAVGEVAPVHEWRDPAPRLVGVLTVTLGLALLVQQLYPGAEWPRTAVAFVAALVSACVWAISLYLGTLVTLLTMPTLLGTGLILIVLAIRRAASGEGFGWQALIGSILILLGWSCVLDPPVGGPFVPIVLVALGGGLLARRRVDAEPVEP